MDDAKNTKGVKQDDASLKIPKEIQAKYPDLIKLIKETESMNEDERAYWFDLIPIMTDEQISNLREILLSEKKKLEELDHKYQQELLEINKKQKSGWQAVEQKEKKKKIKEKEMQAEEQEKKEEKKILEDLESF